MALCQRGEWWWRRGSVAGAQPGAAAAEDRCQTTEENERKTEGERRRMNEWKEANMGGSKGRHPAGPYMDLDPILMALDSYGVTGVLTCSGK
jgi:hypothetical protein